MGVDGMRKEGFNPEGIIYPTINDSQFLDSQLKDKSFIQSLSPAM
jgi:hypothetical protein